MWAWPTFGPWSSMLLRVYSDLAYFGSIFPFVFPSDSLFASADVENDDHFLYIFSAPVSPVNAVPLTLLLTLNCN